MIKLERSLVFFDLETTGLDFINDRVVEISMMKLNIDKTIENYHVYINPDGREICKEAFEKNKLESEFLEKQKIFKQVANDIYDFIKDCDLGGYNISKFDILFLIEEFLRVDIMWDITEINVFDSLKILQVCEPRTLESLYKRMFGEDFSNIHTAEADTMAAAKIFNEQLKLYNLPKDGNALMELIDPDRKNQVDAGGKIQEIDGEYVLMFGKYINHKLKDVYKSDKKYLSWMMTNDSFTREFRIKLAVIIDSF